MASLFEETFNEPLPSRLRPDNLDEFVGQTHLVGKGKILRFFFSDNECLAILNMLQCEAHRELFIEGLKGKIYGKTGKS